MNRYLLFHVNKLSFGWQSCNINSCDKSQKPLHYWISIKTQSIYIITTFWIYLSMLTQIIWYMSCMQNCLWQLEELWSWRHIIIVYLQDILYRSLGLFDPGNFLQDTLWVIPSPQDSMSQLGKDCLLRYAHLRMDMRRSHQQLHLCPDLVDQLHSDTSDQHCTVL